MRNMDGTRLVHRRPGPPRPGPHPSLHARHRRRRAGARDGDQARQEPRRLRPAHLGDGRHQGPCRRHAHGDRHGPPAGAEGGLGDGQIRQQGSPPADRHDQGGGAQHVDRCLQLHGAGGVSQVFKLASMYAHQHTLRLADGPISTRSAVSRSPSTTEFVSPSDQ
jgi:hypothetical protein